MLGQSFEHTAASAGAFADGQPEGQRVDAGLDAHSEHFGQGGLHDVAGAVMHQLGDGAAANRPDIVGGVADGVEDGFVLVEYGPVAAHPDGQAAAGGAGRAAADGGVQHTDAQESGLVVNLADQRRRAGAQVEIGFAGAHSRHNAVLAQRHCLYLHRAGQGCEHHVGLFGDGAGGVGPLRAGFQVLGGGFAADVVHHQIVAAAPAVVRHAGAHSAQADKTCFCHIGHLLCPVRGKIIADVCCGLPAPGRRRLLGRSGMAASAPGQPGIQPLGFFDDCQPHPGRVNEDNGANGRQ